MLSQNIKILLIIIIALLVSFEGKSQKKGKRIELIHADILKGGGQYGLDVKRLIGDVKFKHEGALMYCDSAHFNSKTNTVDAYRNVHIIQDDSLELFGDYLNYNGNTKLAKVRDSVRLIHGGSRLYTDFLDFDRNTNIATYFNHGHIIDKVNDLQSNNGSYYTDLKDYYAIDSVVLINPQYNIFTDTLRYNTGTNISYFYGPTEIVSDSNYLYCENGWYDTNRDISQFNKNAFLKKGEKTLSGDSLYYDRKSGYGEVFNDITLKDSVQNLLLKGNYAIYYEIEEHATITDSALMIQVSDNDSLFLHGDTLRFITFYDTLITIDTIPIYTVITDSLVYDSLITDNLILDSLKTDALVLDSLSKNNFIADSSKIKKMYVDNLVMDTIIIDSLGNKIRIIESLEIKERKEIYAYNKVRIYKSNLQAKCDSLAYFLADSVLKFFIEPILWSEENQISGVNIDLHMTNHEADYFVLTKKAMIISEEDSIRYDQISGKKITGYFRNNQIYKIDVFGNSESVFFPREEAPKDTLIRDSLVNDSLIHKETVVVKKKEKKPKGALIGANIAKGSSMTIYITDSKPTKIVFKKNANGTLNPVDYLPKDKLLLKNFSWEVGKRPKDKDDIFIWK